MEKVQIVQSMMEKTVLRWLRRLSQSFLRWENIGKSGMKGDLRNLLYKQLEEAGGNWVDRKNSRKLEEYNMENL